MPEMRWLFSSYAETLSIRDNRKCRNLINSQWYQQRWGDRFRIVTDQNQKIRYETDKGGYRIATSVGGSNTGEGGDRIVADDPHNVKEGESDAKRNECLLWWDETMTTRVTNPKTTAKIIIMQRCHHADLTGHILEKELGYVHLCLPFEYEEGRKTLLTKTPLPFTDPRTTEGEILSKRWGPKEIKDWKDELGEYGIAGQLQQRPSPRSGGMFKPDKVKDLYVDGIARNMIVDSIRYWDKAGTEGGQGARTAGTLMHMMMDGTWIVEDVKKGRWDASDRENVISQTMVEDGDQVTVWVEQEPGSGGKESAQGTIINNPGYIVYSDRVTGSKEVRADQYAVQFNAGQVKLLVGPWNKSFLDEHRSFPVGKWKDQVDSAAGAFNKLLLESKQAGTWGR